MEPGFCEELKYQETDSVCDTDYSCGNDGTFLILPFSHIQNQDGKQNRKKQKKSALMACHISDRHQTSKNTSCQVTLDFIVSNDKTQHENQYKKFQSPHAAPLAQVFYTHGRGKIDKDHIDNCSFTVFSAFPDALAKQTGEDCIEQQHGTPYKEIGTSWINIITAQKQTEYSSRYAGNSLHTRKLPIYLYTAYYLEEGCRTEKGKIKVHI